MSNPNLDDADYKLKEIFNHCQDKINARTNSLGTDAQTFWEYHMAKDILSIIGQSDES